MLSRVFSAPRVLFALPIVVFIGFAGVKLFTPGFYDFLVLEDSVLEWLQVFLFIVAVVVALLTSRALFQARVRLLGTLYLGLALMLFFVAGEEVSWGQRLLDLETPEFFAAHNMQNEMTIHNLPVLQRRSHILYILIGLYGAVMWLPVRWLHLRRFRVIDGVVPEWYLSSAFFFVAFLQITLAYIVPRAAVALNIEWLQIGGFFIGRDQELAEVFLALGLLLFVLDGFRKARGPWTHSAAGS